MLRRVSHLFVLARAVRFRQPLIALRLEWAVWYFSPRQSCGARESTLAAPLSVWSVTTGFGRAAAGCTVAVKGAPCGGEDAAAPRRSV